MDRKQILSSLKPLVNNPQQWEAFSNYLTDTITQYHKVMEQTDDPIVLHRSQGAIAIMRKMKYLRDEVNQ
jgi:hypothetical protein